MPLESRQQKRFEVDANILVVAIESNTNHINTSCIEGRALNVSASGALIRLDQPIESRRIWVRLSDADRSLSECLVVREPETGLYGVKFACLWSADTLQQLLNCVSIPRRPGNPV